MQVNFNFMQPGNSFMNVNSVNRGLAAKNAAENTGSSTKNKDRVTISPQGKAMNAIKNLMDQKEKIAEQKSELVTKTLESGGSMKSIKTQLDTYAKQLEQIDKQIAQITADQMKKDTEKAEEKKSKEADKNKTEEQLETQNLSNLATASNDIKDAKIVSVAKDRVEGEARVEQSEIKMGKIQIEALESKGKSSSAKVDDMIANAKKMIDVKQAAVTSLTDKAASLGTSYSKNLGDVTNKLNENREPSDGSKEAEASNASDKDVVAKSSETEENLESSEVTA